jgi:co-chaperonin GroES (HSP10)
MPLRVVGPRVLLKPVEQAPRSSLITITDPIAPTVGEVVGIGTTRCSDCNAQQVPDFQIGDVVLIPASAGQEIKIDGDPVWVVPIASVLGFWKGTRGHNADLLARVVNAIGTMKDGEHALIHLQGENGVLSPMAVEVLPPGLGLLQHALTHAPVQETAHV